jgi:hypothetical protein
MGHPDPEVAVDLVFRVVLSALERRVATGPDFLSRNPLDWDRLTQERSLMSVAYLALDGG